MPPLRFRHETEVRDAVSGAIARHDSVISSLLPEAELEHIGATAIPKSLTRGDVDLLVRVPGDEFAAAATALQSIYAIHQPENWTPTFASFKEELPDQIPIGIQLAAQGSDEDTTFLALRELMRSRPDLVESYNDLKRRHEGGDEGPYLEEKAAFFEGLRPLLGG